MQITPSSQPARIISVACLITCLAVASVYLSQSVFPVIAQSYHLPDSAGRLTFAYASIAYAIAFFVIGPLSDLVTPRAMASLGLMVAALALGFSPWIEHYEWLLFSMTVMGAAAAAVPAAMFALVPRMAEPKQVGTYFGLIIAASVVGISVGRSLPGLLADQIGWQGAFVVFAAMLLVAVIAARILPSTQHAPRKESLARIYIAALSLFIKPRLTRLFLIGFLLFFGYLGCVTFMTYRLHQAPFGFDSTHIGAVGFLGLIAVFGAPLSGSLTSRFGARSVALVSLVTVALAIAILGNATTIPVVVAGVLLLFFGVFSCQPAIFTMIASHVEPQRRGAASSMYLLTCLGAGSAASWGLGPLWDSRGFDGVTNAALGVIAAACGMLILDRWFCREGITPSDRKQNVV